MWGGYCPGSSRPHTPPTGTREGKRKLFPSLVYPTLSLICVRKQKGKASASSLRNSANWLQRNFQTRFAFCLRKWKTPPRRAAKASSKRRACFVLFRCWIDIVQNISIYIFYQHRKLTVFLKTENFQPILHKARLSFQPCFRQLTLMLFLLP